MDSFILMELTNCIIVFINLNLLHEIGNIKQIREYIIGYEECEIKCKVMYYTVDEKYSGNDS